MRRAALLVSLLFGTHTLAETGPPLARVVQTSDQARQLLVNGGSFPQRVAVLRLAEELRETLLKALSLKQESYPIARPLLFVLSAEHPKETPPQIQAIEDPGGVKLQLRLAPLEGEASVAVERAILSALLMELSMRGQNAESPPEPRPTPRWLVDALLHKHHHTNPLFAPINLRPLLKSGQLPSPVALLARPEADLTPSTPEETDLARCLLALLTNRPEGVAGVQQMLRADFQPAPLRALQHCFPSLGHSEALLQREWTLAVAAYGTQQERISLDGPQTELEIQRLLQFELTDPATGNHFTFPLNQFADYRRLTGIQGVLAARQLEWIALRERGHFLYGPVLDVYASVCGDLAQGRTADVERRLREATLEQESVSARLSRIRDHMNWFEAVAAPREMSPRLAEFYRILDAQERPKVSDAVRRALDKAEAQLQLQREKEDLDLALDEARHRSQKAKR